MKELNCSYNQLTTFANTQLPDSLKIIECYNNQLTSFGSTQLPNSLEYLICYNNQLTLLPNLPNSLKHLYF